MTNLSKTAGKPSTQHIFLNIRFLYSTSFNQNNENDKVNFHTTNTAELLSPFHNNILKIL